MRCSGNQASCPLCLLRHPWRRRAHRCRTPWRILSQRPRMRSPRLRMAPPSSSPAGRCPWRLSPAAVAQFRMTRYGRRKNMRVSIWIATSRHKRCLPSNVRCSSSRRTGRSWPSKRLELPNQHSLKQRKTGNQTPVISRRVPWTYRLTAHTFGMCRRTCEHSGGMLPHAGILARVLAALQPARSCLWRVCSEFRWPSCSRCLGMAGPIVSRASSSQQQTCTVKKQTTVLRSLAHFG